MAKILVIEDDPHSANIVRRVLNRRGHEVIHTSEGLAGLKMAGEEGVDLVLLDLGLPDIGGHTIAALINRLPGDLPIVAVTGSTDSVTQRRAMNYGCDGYITKPIDTRAFPKQIEAFIREAAEDDEDEDTDTSKDEPEPKTKTGGRTAI